MPTVHDGIGTWYYGKRRILRRKGLCAFCNRVGDLESYDTTLYFVVLFVPLFPLGRKRVFEQCAHCKAHRVLSLKKWEALKDQHLALVLLKQSRPEAAAALLRHVLDEQLRDEAGLLYLLVEGYQAEGLHREALDLMDRRDAAFPDFAESKGWKKQRQTSLRYQD